MALFCRYESGAIFVLGTNLYKRGPSLLKLSKAWGEGVCADAKVAGWSRDNEPQNRGENREKRIKILPERELWVFEQSACTSAREIHIGQEL